MIKTIGLAISLEAVYTQVISSNKLGSFCVTTLQVIKNNIKNMSNHFMENKVVGFFAL